jgi:kinesin family protein 2/24
MDDKADHVPFRASKLTLILRDSFVNKSNLARVVMIACVSPGSSSSDHSLNTLRYADRLKDQTELSKKCD